MNLPRHTLTSHALSPTFVNAQFHNVKERNSVQQQGSTSSSVRLDNGEGSSTAFGTRQASEKRGSIDDMPSSSIFACATRQGYFIARTHPLKIVSRRGEFLPRGKVA
jgi:hypothetical protein